jgi:Lrp/AsnC family leucine-responsive transcriptional regulator
MVENSRSNGHNAYGQRSELLDETNTALLAALHADPRISMSALARQLQMSAPAVTERWQRLERAGIITGYCVDVDPVALGLPVSAYVRIKPAPGQLPKIAALANQLPHVSECHRITGEDCFLLKVHAPAVDQLETILDQFLMYGQTTTSIVQSSPVPPRPLPVGHPEQSPDRTELHKNRQTPNTNGQQPSHRRQSVR